jgi:hypothetical protein
MSIAFDTHAAIQKLKMAGTLATRLDITEVKHDIESLRLATFAAIAEVKHDLNLLEERTKGRFTLLQWMVGFNIALTVLVLAKLFS